MTRCARPEGNQPNPDPRDRFEHRPAPRQIDEPAIRIAVPRGDTSDFRLSRTLKPAELLLVRRPDLPVQQSKKVELAVNLKTARMLGVNFPLTILGRAGEVIE